jgi:hypothetical protein
MYVYGLHTSSVINNFLYNFFHMRCIPVQGNSLGKYYSLLYGIYVFVNMIYRLRWNAW